MQYDDYHDQITHITNNSDEEYDYDKYDEYADYEYEDYLAHCIMDNYTINPLSTFDNDKNIIIFNSDTVEKDKDNDEYSPGTTKCAWLYGENLKSVRYDLSIKKFQIPGCSDCNCGSLDIYSTSSRPAKILARLCSHNITEAQSFKSFAGRILIQFESNASLPKKLEIEVSATPITKKGKLLERLYN